MNYFNNTEEYNPKYYDGKTLKMLNPKMEAINTYRHSDGVVVGMFQGHKGSHPDLDFVVKILRPGKKEKNVTIPHTYWVVDLIIKSYTFPEEVKQILDYYLNFYDRCKPFNSVKERENYSPITVNEIKQKFNHVVVPKTLSVDCIATILELFCLCEKRNEGAFMFRKALETMFQYANGEVDYMDALQASLPGFKR